MGWRQIEDSTGNEKASRFRETSVTNCGLRLDILNIIFYIRISTVVGFILHHVSMIDTPNVSAARWCVK